MGMAAYAVVEMVTSFVHVSIPDNWFADNEWLLLLCHPPLPLRKGPLETDWYPLSIPAPIHYEPVCIPIRNPNRCDPTTRAMAQ